MKNQQDKLNEELLSSANLTEIVDLLNRGADIEVVDECGMTILQIACEKGLCEIAELLLKRGANINYQSRNGKTALISHEINALHSPHICEGYGLH